MGTITEIAAHRSVQASAVAGMMLVAGSTIRPAPGWLWLLWAGLSVVAVRQAVRR